MRFTEDDSYRPGGAEKPGTSFSLTMLGKAPLDIGSNAGVELAVISLDYIDEPVSAWV